MLQPIADFAAKESDHRDQRQPEKPTIERSNGSDLYNVLRWLKSEWDGTNGFWGNRPAIKEAHDSGHLIVLRQGRSTRGFAVLTSSTIFILSVRPKFRRMGYGRLLATHCLDVLRAQGVRAIQVECNPGKSRYFWRALGFTILERPQSSSFFEDYSAFDASHLPQDVRDLLVPVADARIVL